MIQHIDAIYDNGVLKPLAPLPLPDQSRVKLTVEVEAEEEPVAKVARQKAALDDMRRKVDQLPQHLNNDGWSVRQHDELLYGGRKWFLSTRASGSRPTSKRTLNTLSPTHF